MLAMPAAALADAPGGHSSHTDLAAAQPSRLVIRLINADTGEAMSHQNVMVEQAVRTGFLAHNQCNSRTVEVNPGEIVFWARPLPLWKSDFQ